MIALATAASRVAAGVAVLVAAPEVSTVREHAPVAVEDLPAWEVLAVAVAAAVAVVVAAALVVEVVAAVAAGGNELCIEAKL